MDATWGQEDQCGKDYRKIKAETKVTDGLSEP
jgi:hypothetical protein